MDDQQSLHPPLNNNNKNSSNNNNKNEDQIDSASPTPPIQTTQLEEEYLSVEEDIGEGDEGEEQEAAGGMQYRVMGVIGRGSYGSVKKVIDTHTNEVFAAKIISKSLARQARRLDGSRLDIYKESKILSCITHPHIIRLHKVIDKSDEVVLLLEYVEGGSLMALQEVTDVIAPLPEGVARRYFTQLVSAVHYLHRHAIVHRDIKPENLLLHHASDTIKLCDFGLARMFTSSMVDLGSASGSGSGSGSGGFGKSPGGPSLSGQSFSDRILVAEGTAAFMAPEMCSSAFVECSGRATDVWSMGVTLYLFLFGRLPFVCASHDPFAIYDVIVNQPLLFPDEPGSTMSPPKAARSQRKDPTTTRSSRVGNDARDLLRKMLDKEPSTRIKTDDVANHPWLKNK